MVAWEDFSVCIQYNTLDPFYLRNHYSIILFYIKQSDLEIVYLLLEFLQYLQRISLTKVVVKKVCIKMSKTLVV